MSDPMQQADPVSGLPFVRHGVTISRASPMARYSLRARSAVSVGQLLGTEVPDRIGAVIGQVCCLGPDEWLYRPASGDKFLSCDGLSVAATDISDRSICLIVEGDRASEVLMSGCPLDLDRFEVGTATRTIYETVEVILIRNGQHRFEVEIWRSFAPWLWATLTTAASH